MRELWKRESLKMTIIQSARQILEINLEMLPRLIGFDGCILEVYRVVLILPTLPEKQQIEQSKTVKTTLIFARRDCKMKMLIEIWLDGYNTEKEMESACIEFVEEQLNMTASSIKILWSENNGKPT